jgi:hypothetical protein
MASLGATFSIAVVGLGNANEFVVNTFHYDLALENTELDPDVFRADFIELGNILGAALNTCLCNTYTETQQNYRWVSGPGPQFSDDLGGLNLPGLSAAAPAVITNCLIIRRRTGLVGRSGRGRIFISPVPATWIDQDGKIEPAGFNANTAALATRIRTAHTVAASGNIYVPVLYNSATRLSTPIVSAAVAPYMGTMRSRRLQVGT